MPWPGCHGEAFTYKGFEDVEAGIVFWPMSVLRLGKDAGRLIGLGTWCTGHGAPIRMKLRLYLQKRTANLA